MTADGGYRESVERVAWRRYAHAMDEPRGDALFFAFVPDEASSHAGASLGELTGTGSMARASLRSYVNETKERAWSKPMARLTCEEVRLLLGQDLPVWKWLARPVAQFVSRYPTAQIAFYPGDLTIQALRAFDEIAEVDDAAARLLQNVDYSWMPERYSFSQSLAREAVQLVNAAKTKAA